MDEFHREFSLKSPCLRFSQGFDGDDFWIFIGNLTKINGLLLGYHGNILGYNLSGGGGEGFKAAMGS